MFHMHKQCILGARSILGLSRSLLAFTVNVLCCSFSNMCGLIMVEDVTPHHTVTLTERRGYSCILEGFSLQ